MSSIVRFALVWLCCTTILGLDLSVGFAQRTMEFGGSRAENSVNNGADSNSRKGRVKRFDELIEDKTLNKFRGYASDQIGDGWGFSGKYLHFDGSGGGDIITKDTYTDFELQFKWKISEGGNSGVMYRVSTGDKAPYFSGPEYQILDNANHADGKKPETSSGSLYGLYAPDKVVPLKKTWNSSKIIVEGNSITHYLNNKKVVEVEIGSADWKAKVGASKFKDWEKFGKNSSGHIAFQDHGNEVWYRDIRIKRLNSEANEKKTAASSAATESKAATAKGAPVVPGKGDKILRGRGELLGRGEPGGGATVIGNGGK